MNLKRYLAYSLLGCLLVSCGESGEEYPSSGIPIDFSCDVLTRGDITTKDNIASMGVAAFFHSSDFDVAGIVEPNFMKNQLMEKVSKEAGWTYAPVKYWPEGDEQKISFFAYSPHSDENNGLSLSYLQLSYVTPGNSQNHPDLLIATPQKNQVKTSSAISFAFSHILARVSFTFEGTSSAISDVKLSGIKTKGDISLDNGTWSIDGGTTGTVSYLYESANGKDYMMLLPQMLTAEVKLSFFVGETSKEVALSDYGVPQWEQGLAYNYNIIIDN